MIASADRLQDTADCVYVYPPDEETDLQNYLSTLPDDDYVFQPMELSEIGVPTAVHPAVNLSLTLSTFLLDGHSLRRMYIR